MIQFDEKREELKGFSEYYRRELEPILVDSEEARLKAMQKARRISAIIIVAAIAIGIAIFSKTGAIVPLLFPLIGGGAAVTGAHAYLLKDVKALTKTTLVNGICKYVGWQFSETVAAPPDLSTHIENGLLPKRYDRVAFEDHMRGEAHGANFETMEAHMEREDTDSDGDRRWVTVFRGSLMVMDFHRTFLGRTVVLRDQKIFNAKKKKGMKRVGLVDPVFEKIFEAYGTDQVEARYLLTPTFMQRLVDLETSVDGKKIRFGFIDGLLLIVVETKNRFEAGSMFKSLTDTARTQQILDEIDAVFGVVDGLMKPQS